MIWEPNTNISTINEHMEVDLMRVLRNLKAQTFSRLLQESGTKGARAHAQKKIPHEPNNRTHNTAIPALLSPG